MRNIKLDAVYPPSDFVICVLSKEMLLKLIGGLQRSIDDALIANRRKTEKERVWGKRHASVLSISPFLALISILFIEFLIDEQYV